MQGKQLAIASIPVQQWGPIYADRKALTTGTIFKELDLPFYLAENCGCGENQTGGRESNSAEGKERELEDSETLLSRIFQVSFVLDDLTLYLDTHPEDKEALTMYRERNRERRNLKQEFAARYYPLTRDCLAEEEQPFSWLKGPMPWEVCV